VVIPMISSARPLTLARLAMAAIRSSAPVGMLHGWIEHSLGGRRHAGQGRRLACKIALLPYYSPASGAGTVIIR
jgi:hypothetical protein